MTSLQLIIDKFQVKSLKNEDENQWDILLSQAQTGDKAAEKELLKKLAVRLRLILQYRLRGWSAEDREDIIQDVLIIFWKKLPNIKSNPHKFAFQVLRNKVGDALRVRQKIKKVPLEHGSESDDLLRTMLVEQLENPGSTADDFATRLETTDQIEIIRQAIKKLSLFCRTFFTAFFEGKEGVEMWKYFKELDPDLNRSAYDKRIYDCRKRLRELVKDQINGWE